MNKVDKEILSIAQEECAEVIQAISKVFRFGLNESFEGKTNKTHLENELGDLLCMIELILEKKLADPDNVTNFLLNKKDRLKKWSNIYKEEIA